MLTIDEDVTIQFFTELASIHCAAHTNTIKYSCDKLLNFFIQVKRNKKGEFFRNDLLQDSRQDIPVFTIYNRIQSYSHHL